jgi:hypothetical protein
VCHRLRIDGDWNRSDECAVQLAGPLSEKRVWLLFEENAKPSGTHNSRPEGSGGRREKSHAENDVLHPVRESVFRVNRRNAVGEN